MSKQSSELRRYCELHGIKNKYLEEKLHLSSGAVSSILSGRYGISKENAVALSELFGFSIPFLLSGEGSLFPSQSCSATNSQNVIQSSPGSQIGTVASEQELQIKCSALRADLAACQAENERLRNEVDWLRQQISNK